MPIDGHRVEDVGVLAELVDKLIALLGEIRGPALTTLGARRREVMSGGDSNKD